MSRIRWTEFVRSLARYANRRDEISNEVVAEQLGESELRAWRDASDVPVRQRLSDALDELTETQLLLLEESALTDRPLAVTQRLIRDALRQLAISDAIYQAGRRLDINDYETGSRRGPDHGDAVADDRRTLAAEHNAEVRHE